MVDRNNCDRRVTLDLYRNCRLVKCGGNCVDRNGVVWVTINVSGMLSIGKLEYGRCVC
jgi:hypothetical protein